MTSKLKIALASDHAGFLMKENIKNVLTQLGHEIKDFGTNSEASVDFSDYVYPAAAAVSTRDFDRAILVDGAGYPSGIVANQLPGVYAAVVSDTVSARFAREHSDTNVLCLGGKTVGLLVALEIVNIWLTTEFAGGRYQARVEKVRAIAARHKANVTQSGRRVITLQDLKSAIERKESLIIDEHTLITPAVYDLMNRS